MGQTRGSQWTGAVLHQAAEPVLSLLTLDGAGRVLAGTMSGKVLRIAL